jgi:hypothetical protein
MVWVDTYDMTPSSLQIQFGRKPHSPLTTEEAGFWPHHTFPGRLMVDGAQIHAGSTVPEINRNKQGPAFRRGHLDTIFDCDLPGRFSLGLEYGYDFTLSSFSMSKPMRQEKPPDREKRLQVYRERCRREQCDADPAKELEGKPTDWDRINRQVEEAKKVKRPW